MSERYRKNERFLRKTTYWYKIPPVNYRFSMIIGSSIPVDNSLVQNLNSYLPKLGQSAIFTNDYKHFEQKRLFND